MTRSTRVTMLMAIILFLIGLIATSVVWQNKIARETSWMSAPADTTSWDW